MGLIADLRRASQDAQELERYRAASAAQRERDIYDAGAMEAEDQMYQQGLAGQLGGAPIPESGYKERFANWLKDALLGQQERVDPRNATWRDTRAGKPLDRFIKDQGL